jgi:transglutaminase-like putative cysteine protease
MKYKLKHKTKYTYVNSVNNYQAMLCLQPKNTDAQKCENFKLEIEPKPSKICSRIDYFGNIQHYFSIHEPHNTLDVVVSSEIQILEANPKTISNISLSNTVAMIERDSILKSELLIFQLPSTFINWDNEIVEFAKKCVLSKKTLYEGVWNLIKVIYTEFQFKSGATSINTPIKTVLKERKGVCQDFSHLAIACLRSLGVPAKYVSGYIETLPPPGKEKLEGSDASHAWISVYIPEMGWCEFDPTNNMVPSFQHIVTAYGRDFSDISPLRGIIFSSGSHKVKVEVDVIRNN